MKFIIQTVKKISFEIEINQTLTVKDLRDMIAIEFSKHIGETLTGNEIKMISGGKIIKIEDNCMKIENALTNKLIIITKTSPIQSNPRKRERERSLHCPCGLCPTDGPSSSSGSYTFSLNSVTGSDIITMLSQISPEFRTVIEGYSGNINAVVEEGTEDSDDEEEGGEEEGEDSDEEDYAPGPSAPEDNTETADINDMVTTYGINRGLAEQLYQIANKNKEYAINLAFDL